MKKSKKLKRLIRKVEKEKIKMYKTLMNVNGKQLTLNGQIVDNPLKDLDLSPVHLKLKNSLNNKGAKELKKLQKRIKHPNARLAEVPILLMYEDGKIEINKNSRITK